MKLPLEVLDVLLVEYDFLDFFLREEKVSCVIQAVRVHRLLPALAGCNFLHHRQVVQDLVEHSEALLRIRLVDSLLVHWAQRDCGGKWVC